MVAPQRLQSYITAEPFRPFCISMASGQMLVIKHPEMIDVGRSTAKINFDMSADADPGTERMREVSLMLMESIEPLEASTTASS